jgi:predicted O-methyltransferase YrrM
MPPRDNAAAEVTDSIDALSRRLAGVKGFLDDAEGRRLYEIALSAARLGPCLEIGGYCGKSTVYIGAAVKRTGGVLFSVDHHRGSEEHQPGEAYFDPDLFNPDTGVVDTFPVFRRTLSDFDLTRTVVPLVCSSQLAAKAWSMPLSLVFIDGGHSREAAMADYRNWAPHIMPSGFLAVHDIFPTPAEGGQAPREVYETALASGRFTETPLTKTLGVLVRLHH